MEKFGQSLALPKNLLIAAWRLSGDGLALSVIACAMPPLPRGEAFASRKACPLCPRLSLWESWRGAPERARMLTEKSRRSDSIALPKRQLIAVRRLSGDGLALSVSLRSPRPGCGSQRLLRCRSHPAGRGPNSSSLFPPLAAVVAVAPKGRGFSEPFSSKNFRRYILLDFYSAILLSEQKDTGGKRNERH